MNVKTISLQFDETKDALEENLDDPAIQKFEVKVSSRMPPPP